MQFRDNIFLKSNRMRFYIKVVIELSEARISVLNNLKSHLKHSKPYNRMKPILK